jgi:large subunit ribosomal protein L35Ae
LLQISCSFPDVEKSPYKILRREDKTNIIFLKKLKIQHLRGKMKGTINNFKRSIKKTSERHMIIIIDGIKSRAEAAKLAGRKVVYNTGAKDIVGKVASAHGNKGAVRVIFETGMPGQAIGGKVDVQ